MYAKRIAVLILTAVLLCTPVSAVVPNASEESILAEYIAAHAADAPYAVHLAMAASLLNRLSDNRYPDTVSTVLSALGYTPTRHKKAYDSALSAVRTAAAGMDITGGAVRWAKENTAAAADMHVLFSIAGWTFGE